MENKNWLIIILIIVILVLGGILALKIFTDKTIENEIDYAESKESTVKEDFDIQIEDGMDYAENKASTAKGKLDVKNEKEDIQLAITMAMFGNNTQEPLTYNTLNEQLKKKFGEGTYTLTGPNSSGNFSLKINTKTYAIDSNGKIAE